MGKQSRPFTLWALIGCLLFLSVSGLAGGIGMLVDPSGASLSLPGDLLAGLPIDTFVLPGLYLVLVYGLLAPVIAYGLWKRASWAWAAAVVLSVILLGWIVGQFILWGSPHIIQVVYFVLSLAMLILSLVPATRGDQQERNRLIELIGEVQAANPDADPEEVMQDVLAAQQSTRQPGE